MPRTRNHISSLESLATQWRVLGLMAVAFARQILRMERSGARGARKQAEMLELWLHAALAALAAQIATAQQSETNAPHLRRLQAIATALVCLALFITKVKRRLRLLQNAVAADGACTFAGMIPAACSTFEVGYIDTS